MGLVHDERVVLAEKPVLLRFGEKDAIGHESDQGIRPAAIIEADLASDQGTSVAADSSAELTSHPRRHAAGGEATRLCATDESVHAPAEPEADLGQLRRLAGARLAAQDDHLMSLDRGGDLGATFGDRKFLRVSELRASFGSSGALPDGVAEQSLEPLDSL